jgi:hypothetical protein
VGESDQEAGSPTGSAAQFRALAKFPTARPITGQRCRSAQRKLARKLPSALSTQQLQPKRSLLPLAQLQEQKAACVIKGNISSSGERIYHVPGQRYYDKTQINESKGERWFCTEQEAVGAGWRKSEGLSGGWPMATRTAHRRNDTKRGARLR